MPSKQRRSTQSRWSSSLEPDPAVAGEVLTPHAAARLLGVSPRLVLQLARQKKLPGRKIGREWRFRRAALLQWLGKVEPPPPDWVKNLIGSGKAEVIENKPKR